MYCNKSAGSGPVILTTFSTKFQNYGIITSLLRMRDRDIPLVLEPNLPGAGVIILEPAKVRLLTSLELHQLPLAVMTCLIATGLTLYLLDVVIFHSRLLYLVHRKIPG